MRCPFTLRKSILVSPQIKPLEHGSIKWRYEVKARFQIFGSCKMIFQ